MDDLIIPELEEAPIIFRSRPRAVPGDLRPIWRVSLCVLLLSKCCRGGKSSLRRLHVLSWAVRSPEVASTLLNALNGETSPDSVIVRIEPALNRAIDFAIGEGLIKRGTKDRLELTLSGKDFADQLIADALIFVREKRFVEQVGFNVSEGFVNEMFDRGSSL